MIILQKTQVCDLRDVSKISVHPTRDRVVGFVLNDRSSQKRQFLCFKLCKKSKIKVTALILILVYNVCILMCFRVMSLRDCIKRGFDFIILSQKSGSVYTQKLKSNPPYLPYSVCVYVCVYPIIQPFQVTRPQLLQRCTIPMGQARQVQAGNTLKVARPRLRREKLPQILCVAGHPMPLAPAEENKSNPHRYGYYINGKVVKVAYRSEEIHVPQIIPPPPPPLPPVQVPSNEPITGTIHESPTYENLSQLQDIMC